jgi:hypothetical protein
VFDTKQTKELMNITYELHTLNVQHKSLALAEKVFVLDKDEMLAKRLKIEEDIHAVLVKLEDALIGERNA